MIAAPAFGTSVASHDIQGNVLHGYGLKLPRAVYLVVDIVAARAGRRLISDLLGQVTSAHHWGDDPPARALNIALSYQGLWELDVPLRLLDSFPPEFVDGMGTRAERLGDRGRSAPETWERGLRDIELLLVLHARDAQRLADEERALVRRIERDPGLRLVSCQKACVLPGAREHFNYSDGFGQPIPAVAWRDAEASRRAPWHLGRMIALGEFVHGYRDEDDLLAAAPASPFDRNGTFMVFRKLAQDVAGFRQLLADLANRDFNGDEDLAAAKLAGRWPDGTPLSLRPTRIGGPALLPTERDEFDFTDDPDGHKCPLGAHIRRANPRNGLHGGYDRSRRHRIIRRGMPYGPWLPKGEREQDPDADPAKRGLLFVCLNASIARQFEVVNSWLNDGATFGLGGDVDVLAGAAPARPARLMSIQGEPPVLVPARSLVWTRGGEYLFLPSLRALAALAEGRWDG